jgi:hypothetical protein
MAADVQNMLAHMRGQWISIDGHDYKLDDLGIVRGVPEEDAKQLLQRKNTAWRRLPERTPVAEQAVTAPAPLPEPIPEKAVEPLPVPEPVPSEPPAVSDPAVLEKVPGPDEDWPDPTPEMSLEFLQQMAGAYRVKFNKNTTKAVLIKKITQAMFE